MIRRCGTRLAALVFALTLVGAVAAPVVDGLLFHSAGGRQTFGAEFDGPAGGPGHGAHCLLYRSRFTPPANPSRNPATPPSALIARGERFPIPPLPTLSPYSGFDLPQRGPLQSAA